jgi:general stress protein YciG
MEGTNNMSDPNKPLRGFAMMDPVKRQEVATLGGKAAQAKGRAHRFTPEEARAAGKKGGAAVSRDTKHMAKIGRAGGLARSRNLGFRHDTPGTTTTAAAAPPGE